MDTPLDAHRVQDALARRTWKRVRKDKHLKSLYRVIYGEYIGTSLFCEHCRDFWALARRK